MQIPDDFLINKEEFLKDGFEFLNCKYPSHKKVAKNNIHDLFEQPFSSSNTSFELISIRNTSNELVGVWFVWDKKELWKVEEQFFLSKEEGKEPELTIEYDKEEWDYIIKLNNSLFPGTNLSADFKCKLKKINDNPEIWNMNLTMLEDEKVMFNTEVDLEKWLKGDLLAISTVIFRDTKDICNLKGSTRILIDDDLEGKCCFSPDWEMRIIDNKVIIKNFEEFLKDGHDRLEADNITIALRYKDNSIHKSMFQDPLNRKTLLTIHRCNVNWPIRPKQQNIKIKKDTETIEIGRFKVQDNSFDTINVESGVHDKDTKKIKRILVATCCQSKKISFQVAQDQIKDLNNDTFQIRLLKAQYVIEFETPDEWWFSHFDDNAQWLVVKGNAIQITDDSSQCWFRVRSDPKKSEFYCEPLLSKVIPWLREKDLSQDSRLQKEMVLDKSVVFDQPNKRRLKFVFDVSENERAWGILIVPHKDNRFFSLPGSTKTSNPSPIPEYQLDFVFSILRPEDLLYLEFFLYNLTIEVKSDNTSDEMIPRLTKINKDSEAFVSIIFSSQNIAEEVFSEGKVPSLPAKAVAAGQSRLVFKVKDDIDQFDYSLENLLNWDKDHYTPSLVPSAEIPDPPPKPLPQIPDPTEPPQDWKTSIEAPWNLFISTLFDGTWKHANSIVKHGDYTELWNTTLDTKKNPIDTDIHIPTDYVSKIRAIWTSNFPDPSEVEPIFKRAIEQKDRVDIVRLSSSFSLKDRNRNRVPPKTIPVRHLMLSSLGAWINLRGFWPEDYFLDNNTGPIALQEWEQRSTIGRDHFVKIVRKGHLCFSGHRCTLLIESERRVRIIPGSGKSIAYIEQTHFLNWEKEEDYSYLETHPASVQKGRNFVFNSLRINSQGPIIIDEPENEVGGTNEFFFPKQNGKYYHFNVEGIDNEGRKIEFSIPMMFIESGKTTGGLNKYFSSEFNLRESNLSGQLISFAKNNKTKNAESIDTTSFPTYLLRFSAIKLEDNHDPPFYPSLDLNPNSIAGKIKLPAIERTTGTKMKLPLPIKFNDIYLRDGFGDRNKGDLFINFIEEQIKQKKEHLKVQFSKMATDKVGGITTPDLKVAGLSRTFGTVNDVDSIVDGRFEPEAYFGEFLDAKLLGTIQLKDIIGRVDAGILTKIDKVPKILTIEYPQKIETVIEWKPDIKTNEIITFNNGNENHLELTVRIVTPLKTDKPIEPEITIEGKLQDFNLVLFGDGDDKILKIKFKYVTFSKKHRKKIETKVAFVEIDPIEFGGPLQFINKLKDLIPFGGFDNGPYVKIVSDGMELGYALPLPNISIGAFNIENIRLNSSVHFSFRNEPIRFRFAFSERHDPFISTVSMLGGAGFFGLAIGPDGIEIMELSLEYGAHASVFLGAASGSLHMMAGIYLKFDKNEEKPPPVTGFIRAYGCLEVLGLITASVEFYLELTYVHSENLIRGFATIKIEIKMFMFSRTAHVTLEREWDTAFSSFVSINDPQVNEVSFEKFMNIQNWKDYWSAFEESPQQFLMEVT